MSRFKKATAATILILHVSQSDFRVIWAILFANLPNIKSIWHFGDKLLQLHCRALSIKLFWFRLAKGQAQCTRSLGLFVFSVTCIWVTITEVSTSKYFHKNDYIRLVHKLFVGMLFSSILVYFFLNIHRSAHFHNIHLMCIVEKNHTL